MNEITQTEMVEEERVSEITDVVADEETIVEMVSEETPPAVIAPQVITSVPESPSAAVMAMIAQATADPRVDVAKMKELFDLRREIMKDQAAIDARQAYGRVCRKMPRITKRGAIDFGKGQKPIAYAKWEDIADVIRPIYEVENFTLSYDTRERNGGGLIVTARLEHDNGHVITSEFPVPLDTSGGKQNIQGMGSAGSYGQRYATKNLFNLVFENDPVDDDGKLAGDPPIDEDKIEQIATLIDETDSDPQAFMQWAFGDEKPHNYGEITTSKFPSVLNALLAKKRKQAQDKKNAANS